MKRSAVVRYQYHVLGAVLTPFPVQRTPYFALFFQGFCGAPICLHDTLIGAGIYTRERERKSFDLRLIYNSRWLQRLSSLISFSWVDCGLSSAV